MTLYVFAYSGYDSEVLIVEAENEDEAVGKATQKNNGVQPTGDPTLIEEVLDDDGAAKLA